MIDRQRLGAAIREMKQRLQNDPELMARFDKDGDGLLLGSEWEAVRAHVIEALEREDRELAESGDPEESEGFELDLVGDLDRLDHREASPLPVAAPAEGASSYQAWRDGGAGGGGGGVDAGLMEGNNALLTLLSGALFAVFFLPWIYFNISLGPMGGESKLLWGWDMTGSISPIFVYLPLVAAPAMWFAGRQEREIALKAGGVIGALGLLSFVFVSTGGGMPDQQEKLVDVMIGPYYFFIPLGALILALAAYHRSRHRDSAIAHWALIIGGLLVVVGLLMPQEIIDIKSQQQTDQMPIAAFFSLASAFGDDKNIGMTVTGPLYLIAFAHVMMLVTAGAAIASTWLWNEDDQRALANKLIYFYGLFFIPIISLIAFIFLYSLGSATADMMNAQFGGAIRVEFTILAPAFIWQGVMWIAYALPMIAGASHAIEVAEGARPQPA